MDQNTAAAAAAIQEYEHAMANFLARERSGEDGQSDFELRTRLYVADIEIERLQLRHTPAYCEAVLRADSRASAMRVSCLVPPFCHRTTDNSVKLDG